MPSHSRAWGHRYTLHRGRSSKDQFQIQTISWWAVKSSATHTSSSTSLPGHPTMADRGSRERWRIKETTSGSSTRKISSRSNLSQAHLDSGARKEQHYHRNVSLKHWKRKCAKKPLPMLHTRLYTSLTWVLSMIIMTLSCPLQQAPIQIPCISTKRWSNLTRPSSSKRWRRKSNLLKQTIIGNCFTDPSSRKDPLFYLQCGRWSTNAKSSPERFTRGRHAWISMEVSR